MTFESSNSNWVERLSDEGLVDNIRIAMEEGCIRPSHIFDEIDELIQRFCKLKGIKNGKGI